MRNVFHKAGDRVRLGRISAEPPEEMTREKAEKRFESLGAGSAKILDTPPMVEIAPRPLTKIENRAGTLIHKILGSDAVVPDE